MQFEQTVALVPGFEPAAVAPPQPLGPVAAGELVAPVELVPVAAVVDKMPMVCIMGEKASTPDAFPDDGLCDYIFFDSLYKDGRNMLSRQATFSKSLSNFIKNRPAYQGTHLGVGFSFNYLQSAEEDLKVKEPNPLQPLWDQGIFSVGIFDRPHKSLENQKAAIGTLKKIDDLLQMPKQLGHHVATALAAPDPQFDWSLQYALDFSKVGFDPYIFIAIGHYTYGDNTVRNCAIMPPTRYPFDFPDDENITSDYNYDLGTALFAAQQMSLKRTRLRALVSVTLKGRWNVLRSSDKVEFFERCVSDPSANSFGSYTEAALVDGIGGAAGELDWSRPSVPGRTGHACSRFALFFYL
ncbi:hypothetical protein HPB52_018475 [Rhipicephalus sanguineus]|uniref:Uncharacterized protein n=1 Tax=Rhipicephalus sanguineus TaxID=34632 RepID=A0A9D4PL88_RHISA|nr:hypothetical protein HPB52_018475 [Rhipicephalus sanguineus]